MYDAKNYVNTQGNRAAAVMELFYPKRHRRGGKARDYCRIEGAVTWPFPACATLQPGT